ncbi:MAG: hypothetical protein OEZ06_18200 [Myxococcales bacterium]|nr:hypothetical protein [Myxococcales bacterium]
MGKDPEYSSSMDGDLAASPEQELPVWSADRLERNRKFAGKIWLRAIELP